MQRARPVPKGSAEMVAATIRTIFAQPGPAQVREQLQVIAAMLGPHLPKVETMLLDGHDAIHPTPVPAPLGWQRHVKGAQEG